MGWRGLKATGQIVAACVVIAACSSAKQELSPASSSEAAPASTGVTQATTATSSTTAATPPPATTQPPATTVTTATTVEASTTVAPITTADASAATTSTAFVNVVPSAPCAFSAAVPAGEVTWVQDGQLRALGDGGLPICLVEGVSGTSPLTWSSDAGRVLTSRDSATSAGGTRSTGFGEPFSWVTLSAPSGTATIGIDPNGHLIRHGSDGAESDISFLARTETAIYHPSGKRIIAVGFDAAGAYGIWLSSNLGADAKQILSVADPATPVTDLSLSPDGSTLYFIHGSVHQLLLPVLALTELGVTDRHEANLVVSKVEDAQAWSIGPCDSTGTALMRSANSPAVTDVRTLPGSPFASAATLVPVGWLSGYRLVIAVRPSGCGGPADIWIWSPADGFRQIAAAVLAPSVRIPRGPWTDLPDVIEQAAPG